MLHIICYFNDGGLKVVGSDHSVYKSMEEFVIGGFRTTDYKLHSTYIESILLSILIIIFVFFGNIAYRIMGINGIIFCEFAFFVMVV
mmetsp:Transcript_25301/g.35448  ORF Transcript_25301/g.35448 Transcript_25301/m.35448 type:complete len:87 (+) Transcript_25301:1349-1609(+)